MTCVQPVDRVRRAQGFSLFALWLTLSCPAFAQEPSSPEEQSPPQKADSPWLPDDTAPLALEGEGSAGPRGWSYSGEAQGGWESNPVFESSTDPSSWLARLGGGLGYATAGRRSAFSVNANGGATDYFNLEGRDRYYYSGGLSWVQRFSQRTTFTLSETLTNDYSQNSALLIEGGILLPLSRALTSRTAARLRQTLNPVLGLEARVQYDYVDFATPTLADGDQLDSELAMNRRFGERHSASLSYSFLSSASGGQPRLNYHSAYLGGSKRLSLTTTASANLGATALPQPDGSWRVIPSALAHLSALNARTRLHVDARYEHRASQAFGLGQDRIADIASLALQRPFGRKWTSDIGLNYTLSKDTGGQAATFHYNTLSVDASMAYRATRRLSLDLGYSYFRSSQVTPSVDNHSVNVGITYRKEPE